MVIWCFRTSGRGELFRCQKYFSSFPPQKWALFVWGHGRWRCDPLPSVVESPCPFSNRLNRLGWWGDDGKGMDPFQCIRRDQAVEFVTQVTIVTMATALGHDDNCGLSQAHFLHMIESVK